MLTGCRRTCPSRSTIKRDVFRDARRARAGRRGAGELAPRRFVASQFTEDARGTRALPRRASGQSAAPGAGGRAVRRAVDQRRDARARARGDDGSVGQVPIVVRREIDGFILNRLQGALLSEAMRLVGEGYVSPEDLDKTVRARPRPALVVHGAVRDDRAERARRRGRLLRALQRLLPPARERSCRRRQSGTSRVRERVAAALRHSADDRASASERTRVARPALARAATAQT